MSAQLADAAISYLRAQLPRSMVADLRAYGGEFNAAEADATSYVCPAVLVTSLGWRPEHESRRLAGRDVRSARLAAFVAFKHARRDERLRGAALLAEALCVQLRAWRPDSTGLPIEIGTLEEEPRAENMYSRAMDAKGQALWLVTWEQCFKSITPLPQLYDLLAIEIVDLVRQGATPEPAPAPAPTPLQVTEDITYAPLPPAV